jgi:signal transduction histidine kinase
MKQLTRSSMDQLRRSLAGLRTPGLGDRPLKTAIEQFCQELTERSGLTVDCRICEKAAILPPAISEVLWRAVHEGLANAEKHSHARAIQVSLELDGCGDNSKGLQAGSTPVQATLQVVDDGVGMPAGPESTPGHYGLRGLRERVEGLGGTFNISKGNPKGVRLEFRIPVVSL